MRDVARTILAAAIAAALMGLAERTTVTADGLRIAAGSVTGARG